MIKKCLGCGVKLQDTNENEIGYVKDIKMDYCMRCFKLKNYHELSNLTPNYQNDEIIELINVRFDKCVFLVDLLNLNSEVIDTFKRISIPKLLVISKLDMIPKSIKLNNVLKRIRMIYQIDEDLITISSLKSININLVRNYMQDSKTCIAGFTNSGKSSLINALTNKDEVLTSSMVNTTLDFIKIEEDGLVFYDSPGLRYQNKVNDSYVITDKTKELKPVIYQIKSGSGIKLDDIVIFNNDDKTTNLTLYVNNNLKITKIFKKEKGNYLNLKLKNQDIVIKNLGFIATREANNLDITNVDNLIEIRDTIFKVI